MKRLRQTSEPPSESILLLSRLYLHHLVIFAERGRQRLIWHLIVCMCYTVVYRIIIVRFAGIMRKFTRTID